MRLSTIPLAPGLGAEPVEVRHHGRSAEAEHRGQVVDHHTLLVRRETPREQDYGMLTTHGSMTLPGSDPSD